MTPRQSSHDVEMATCLSYFSTRPWAFEDRGQALTRHSNSQGTAWSMHDQGRPHIQNETRTHSEARSRDPEGPRLVLGLQQEPKHPVCLENKVRRNQEQNKYHHIPEQSGRQLLGLRMLPKLQILAFSLVAWFIPFLVHSSWVLTPTGGGGSGRGRPPV